MGRGAAWFMMVRGSTCGSGRAMLSACHKKDPDDKLAMRPTTEDGFGSNSVPSTILTEDPGQNQMLESQRKIEREAIRQAPPPRPAQLHMCGEKCETDMS